MMKKLIMLINKLFLLTLFISLYFCKDETPVEPEILEPGKIVSTSSSGSYSAIFIDQFVKGIAGSTPINVNFIYDVDAYKVVYRTLDHKGNLTIASGVLFISKGKDNLSIVSLQHGTQTKRTSVGSVNPLSASEGLIAASLGYFSVVPDYLGLGESTILHPYHHQKSSANAVIDIIRAGKEFAQKKNIKLNGQVFLAGYSEGGYVTLAAHKEIEQNYKNEITITASAPMAGAYDLNFTARKIINNKIYNQPSYLAFFMVAYNDIYGWNNLNSIFNSPYAEKIPPLFDGTKSTSEINAQLTNDLTKLFNQNFINTYLNDDNSPLAKAFTENSLINWKPESPMKLFHGNADEYVPYENATRARDYFKSLGSDVELITISGGTHLSAALPSIIGAMEWFEQIRIKKLYANQLAER
jgi:predicted esterase